jgi:perosamine synthetase
MQTSNPIVEAAKRGIRQYLKSVAAFPAAMQEHYCGATGPVAALEAKLRKSYEMKHALCVSNATTGLFALALASEIKSNEFLTTPFTYGASLAGWLMLNNRPIFADIDPETLALDVKSARHAITSKTKAILAVDIFGIPSDTKKLRSLADDHGIWYFADASQSMGASREGLHASSLADALVVSFTANKPLTAGEGGAILTNNTVLYERLVWATQHPARHRRELGLDLDNEFAFNSRIAPTSAAWATSTFEASMRKVKRHQAECLRIIENLNDIGFTAPIDFAKNSILPSFFRLTAAWQAKPKEEALLQELRRRSFQLSIEPSPVRLIYRQPAFKAQYPRFARAAHSCRRAEQQSKRRFCLNALPS